MFFDRIVRREYKEEPEDTTVGGGVQKETSSEFTVIYKDGKFSIVTGTEIPSEFRVYIDNAPYRYGDSDMAKKAVNTFNVKQVFSDEEMERCIENQVPALIVKKCRDCGCQFMIDWTDYRFFMQKKLAVPKRCKKCRQERKYLRATGSIVRES